MQNLYEVPKGFERRMQILRAIAGLLQDCTLNDLTVEAICARAGISRMTFYRYFEGKSEALIWFHSILGAGSIPMIGRTLTWHEASLEMNRGMFRERELYSHVYGFGRDLEELIALGAHLNMTLYTETILDFNGIEMTPMLAYEIRYWAEAVYRIMIDWVHGGFLYTPEELADFMDDVRPRLLTLTMDEPVLARRAGMSA